MTEHYFQMDPISSDFFPPSERDRVVRLAAAITGRPDAAEDLAQEALLEAWRSRGKLVEPEGAPRWLSAVTRNVCLRWIRSQGRASAHLTEDAGAEPDLDDLAGKAPDLEIELEREELAELLDRAMAHLPGETRQALVQRYVLELPQAEIAGRLGLSEGAVEARLQRGKLSLHKLLVSRYRSEAASFGLAGSSPSSWVETRLWCPICGQRHLYGVLPQDTGEFELHCPNCSWAADRWFAQSTMLPVFNEVKGFRATLKRFDAYMVDLFAPRLTGDTIACRRCGAPVPIQYELPPSVHGYSGLGRRGLYIRCPKCGMTSHTDLYGIGLSAPRVQSFLRANPRVRTLPELEVTAGEKPALLLRFESMTVSSSFEVLLSKDRYELIGGQEVC
jgi:RNA polymerase sigma factor (sigma-70 family)